MRTVGGPASSSTPLLPLKPRKSRQYRPNVILGRIIPLLLVFFAYHAALLVVYDSGYQLRIKSRGERVWGTIYLLHFGILFSVLAYSFGVIRLKERIRTPHDPPVAVLERSVVYECSDELGTPARCYEGGCAGAWRPLRTRHCKDCNSCQVEFDHHCAFLGACIAKQSIKSFTLFLIVVVPLISISLYPLVPIVWRGLRSVVSETWDSEELRERWWGRKISWIGGPVYRYAGELIYGYILYPTLSPTPAPILSSPLAPPSLATPHLAPLLITLSASLIILLALAMIYVVLSNAINGVTTIEVERSRRWNDVSRKEDGWDPRLMLWIPGVDGAAGRVVLVDTEVRLHDFGMVENWRRFVGSNWWEWIGYSAVDSFSPEISPSAMQYLNDE